MTILPMRNIEREWVFQDLAAIPGEFQSGIGGGSIVSQTLFRRGLTTLDAARGFLNPDYYHPTPPSELPGLIKAVERINIELSSPRPILIWGDFDVDGQTSTTLLVSALTDLGARAIHYIPNRASESHGLSVDSLARIIEQFQPGLIITCDTGIDAFEPVLYANSKSIDVIITDHHQLPPQLPDAFAIVNPAILDSDHPLASLPGVGVAYKLIEEIFSRYDFDPTRYLDLVALGIVADVAHLSRDTRYLLQKGLAVLRETPRPGLRLLFENANLNAEEIGEDQIGFSIGPRLNSLGRLSDANSCVDFFTRSDPEVVLELATQLEILNVRRQELTERIFNETQEMVSTFPELDQDFPILVLQGPTDWNPGVIGIVASRLVERYHKPVIILSEDRNEARGSARSVKGVGISELISLASSLLTSHGGHPMAAGVSLPLENVPQFRRELAKKYSLLYGDTPPAPLVHIDGELPFKFINKDFVTDFKRLSPFGAGNPRLLFATRNITTITDKTIGRKRNHRKLLLADSSGTKQEFLWWNSIDMELPKGSYDIVYSLNLSSYRDQLQTQATIQHYRQSVKTPVHISKSRKIDLVDLRASENQLGDLKSIVKNDKKAVTWSEYSHPKGIQTYSRLSIEPAETLIIWTTPPSVEIFKQLVDKVSPQKLILISRNPGINTQKDFLEALLGLLKHLSKSEKSYRPDVFAQRISQTNSIIETGLDWLHFHGDFDLTDFRSNSQLKPGPQSPLPNFSKIDKILKIMHHEIRAYRAYFQTADIHSIL